MNLNYKLLQDFSIGTILRNKNIKFDIGYPKYKIIYGTITNDAVNEIHNQLTNETNNEINVRY